MAAGGIVSSAYCLLYKLFTLKLTRRQVQAMLNHVDSPYIRGLGIMYIRYYNSVFSSVNFTHTHTHTHTHARMHTQILSTSRGPMGLVCVLPG